MLAGKDHLEDTNVGLFPSFCAPQEDRETAAKDALLLTSAKKHPTQFGFALRLQCDPLNVSVNEIAAYLQLPALNTELTVFTQDHCCCHQTLATPGSVVPATFHR